MFPNTDGQDGIWARYKALDAIQDRMRDLMHTLQIHFGERRPSGAVRLYLPGGDWEKLQLLLTERDRKRYIPEGLTGRYPELIELWTNGGRLEVRQGK